MTKDEFAVKYASDILNSSDKEKETAEVIEAINTLTYKENDKPLSDSDKKYIIDMMYNLVLEGRYPKDRNGRRVILNEKENLGYIEMIKAVSAKLAEVKGK